MDLDRVAIKIVNLTDEQLVVVTREALAEVRALPRWRWFKIQQLNILLTFCDLEMGRRLHR